jgi:hypothetical protein
MEGAMMGAAKRRLQPVPAAGERAEFQARRARTACAGRFVSAASSARLEYAQTRDVPMPAGFAPELTEVQFGSYFGEDGILRLEDIYYRHAEA